MRDFRLPPRHKWDLRSSGMSRSVDWSSRIKQSKNLEDGTDWLSRNVANKLRNIPEERRSHTIINTFSGKNLQTLMFKKWKHVQIRRTPSLNKISIYLPYLISNLRRVVNVVFFLLGDFPASECYVPTFRNTLFHLHRCEQEETQPMKME
jgi:hypothetical protein